MESVIKPKYIIIAIVVGVILFINTVFFGGQEIVNIADIAYSSTSGSVVASYEEDNIVIKRLSDSGNVNSTVTIPRTEDGYYVTILDMIYDEEGYLYLLKQVDKGASKPEQELQVYNFDNFFFKHVETHKLDEASEIIYRWLSLDGSLFLSGTNANETQLTRESYDKELLWDNAPLEEKFSRSYMINPEEGIYDIVPYADDTLYIAKSGKLFLATEGEDEPTELYPARELESVMYPMYVAVRDDVVILGEQESGDILTLDVESRETTTIKRGSEPFTGDSSFTPDDILAMSMEDITNFLAVTRNSSDGSYNLLITTGGQTIQVSNLSGGFFSELGSFIIKFIVFYIIALLLLATFSFVSGFVSSSRTIVAKLSYATLPVLVIALVLFGFFSYFSTKISVVQSSENQVLDEGNLLAALFGAEVFDEMEFPYDYTGDAYNYLIGQMGTRTNYTRTAYYEYETLFTGVDFDTPLFYPFNIVMNTDATNLYLDAVYTGVAQTGIINDNNGIRISCVTPIGGISGGTVYLIETSVPYYNIDNYANTFLIIYIIAALIFLVATVYILNRIFKNAMRPIGNIKMALEQFSAGNTSVRLDVKGEDEISDIIKVFNNMASDIDLKMYDLQAASKTYYRFIPQKVFALLGKESLAEIELGNSIESVYDTVTASLEVNSNVSTTSLQEITNTCYNIISESCERFGATLVADSVNLRRLQIICPNGANSAIDIALTSLSRIDGANTKVPLQSRVKALFVVHKTNVHYGIFGDEQRYVPSIISRELDYIAENESLFREFATRLIVTSTAFEGIDKENYFYRFIGNLTDAQRNNYALYDFYDSSSTGETHLINETKATFDKAMELYLAQRYYEAKSLFAIVLRENQYDNVARYYIFKCERNL